MYIFDYSYVVMTKVAFNVKISRPVIHHHIADNLLHIYKYLYMFQGVGGWDWNASRPREQFSKKTSSSVSGVLTNEATDFLKIIYRAS